MAATPVPLPALPLPDPIVDRRWFRVSAALGELLEDEVPNRQGIEAAAKEAANSVLDGADDGLALYVERGVKHHGRAGDAVELVDQTVVERVVFLLDRLRSDGPVNVHNCRNFRRSGLDHVEGKDHEWMGTRVHQVLPGPAVQDGGSERAPRLPVLDGVIEPVFDRFFQRIGQDGPAAQRPGAHFGFALEPPHDLAPGQSACHLRGDIRTWGEVQLQVGQCASHLVVIEFRAPVSVGHLEERVEAGVVA